MKALGLVVLHKKIFENCILKTYFLTLWPTYATNWNGLSNFDRGPPRDHSCEVWSKSNKRFQRRCCLKKLLTDARTDARTDDGHWRITKAHLSTSCSGELKISHRNRLKKWHLLPWMRLGSIFCISKSVPTLKTWTLQNLINTLDVFSLKEDNSDNISACNPETPAIRDYVNIIHGDNFKNSKTLFVAQTRKMKEEGMAKINHHPAIEPSDMAQLYDYVCADLE